MMRIKDYPPVPGLVTRLAPTPSGYLHLGNAWCFVLTWLLARHFGGRLHLRIDSLDGERVRPEYLEDVFSQLDWLGLDWDAGPQSPEAVPDHAQEERLPRYRETVLKLRERGGLYACGCSRKTIQEWRKVHPGSSPAYPRLCRNKGLDWEGRAWRFKTAESAAVVLAEWGSGTQTPKVYSDPGDFVVWQKNGRPAYQLFSLVDDEDRGVNTIVRGRDLLPSSGAQLALASPLNFKNFSNALFWHLPLVLNEKGEKISKSRGATSLTALRRAGVKPEAVYRLFARWLHLPEESGRDGRGLLTHFPEAVPPRTHLTFYPRDLL